MAFAYAVAPSAQDWPQWRGPARDGAIAAFNEPATWPAALTKRWQVDVGSGYSTPLVVGDRVYAFSREGEDEVLRALDAGTGRQLWRASYPAAFTMNPAPASMGPARNRRPPTPTAASSRWA